MNQPTNQELFDKLKILINKNSLEIKSEIKSINDSLNQKLCKLEEIYGKIEKKVIQIERANKKNNIVIFGLQTDGNNLLKTTLSQLNGIFDNNFVEKDINNIYFIGKKNTIIVEFISFLQKKNIFKQLYKLKGSGISISHDLRIEDQKTNKILVKHLKEAKAKNQKTYIKNFKLYVNGVPYTVEELENPGEDVFDKDSQYVPPHKNNSAPATPTIQRNYLEEFEETVENNKNTEETKETEERQTDKQQQTETSSNPSSFTTPNRSQANVRASTSNNSKNANVSTKIKEVNESRVLRNKKSTS